METKNLCQSCAMPLDSPSMLGSEKDGSASHDYCKYCYQNGEFTSPGVTLAEWKDRLTKIMKDKNLPENIGEATLKLLPTLKRWNRQANLAS